VSPPGLSPDEARDRLVALLHIRPALIEELGRAQTSVPELRGPFEALRQAVRSAADERRRLGEELRAFADRLLVMDGWRDEEIVARMAVARYYYSIHHLLRSAFMVTRCYDCVTEGSGGHGELFGNIARLAAEQASFYTALEHVEELGATMREAVGQAWNHEKESASEEIRCLLEDAIARGGEPSERADYLRARLDRERAERGAVSRKAASKAIEHFLGTLHRLRTRADYDPLGRSDARREPVDFVLEAPRMGRLAASFAAQLGGYMQSVGTTQGSAGKERGPQDAIPDPSH